MNPCVESVLDAEDMRRRCAAHEAWVTAHPHVLNAALAFGRANQRALADADVNAMLFKNLATPER